MGQSTRIDWCDASWNPVTGCLHGCEYCYARGIANRFGFLKDDGKLHELNKPCTRDYYEDGEIAQADVKQPYPNSFAPTFHRYRLDEPQRWKKPRTIFVCSMADLFGDWVPWEWIWAVFEACDKAPQHRYIFLTKNPKRYMMMYNSRYIREMNAKYPDKPMKQTEEYKDVPPLPRRDNWWFGSTLDSISAKRASLGITDHTFVSIEPLTERMDVGLGSFGGDEWVIIGAETGNRKGKVIPKKDWVMQIVEAASITHMKVFMKESLRGLMGDDFRQEFPWEANNEDDQADH